MDTVRVKVMTTPRLLADLIAVALRTPAIRTWVQGDAPPEVTIVNTLSSVTEGGLTIVLGDRLGDPISIVINGEWSSVAPVRLEHLSGLVLELTRAEPVVTGSPAHDGPDGQSAG